MKKILISATVLAAVLSSCSPSGSTKMTTLMDSVSYSIGIDIAHNMVAFGSDKDKLNAALIAKGIEDVLKTDTAAISNTQMQAVLERYFMEVRPNQMKAASDQQMEELKKANPDAVQTESGLLYQIMEAGDAAVKPTPQDTITANYVGTYPDGTEFDSSNKHGQPLKIVLGNLIPGWIEGMQLIGKGGKIKMWIPFDLGYGGARGEELAQPLIFEVELVDVTPPAAK